MGTWIVPSVNEAEKTGDSHANGIGPLHDS